MAIQCELWFVQVQVTIVDVADAGYVQFARQQRSVAHTAKKITLNVVRRRGCCGALSVQYFTQDDSAVAGAVTWYGTCMCVPSAPDSHEDTKLVGELRCTVLGPYARLRADGKHSGTGQEFEQASGSLRFEHNEGLKTIDIQLGSAPQPKTSFLVFLKPSPEQPTINGDAYVCKRRGVVRVDIVADDSIAKVCMCAAMRLPACAVRLL